MILSLKIRLSVMLPRVTEMRGQKNYENHNNRKSSVRNSTDFMRWLHKQDWNNGNINRCTNGQRGCSSH